MARLAKRGASRRPATRHNQTVRVRDRVLALRRVKAGDLTGSA